MNGDVKQCCLKTLQFQNASGNFIKAGVVFWRGDYCSCLQEEQICILLC